MYQIKCNGFILYDPRDEELVVQSPRCKLAVNTVGEASFSIFANHPYYEQLQKMRSVFEITQDGQPIFRGRMTEDTRTFDNTKLVDLEGALAYFNDSVVRPFSFPNDFLENQEYIEAAESGNVIEFFLKWLIDQHNLQTQPFQHFVLGRVTVADPNNYLSRSNNEYMNTWEVLKSKLFETAIGGYLCVRYEADGNYIDYLEDFEYTNTQRIEYGENLLDLSNESDASETYSAVIPLGCTQEDQSRLTVAGLPDGNISEDVVKEGDVIYSISALEQYGFICAPTYDTTWEDVTDAANLQRKAVDYLVQKAMRLTSTITIRAVDLHFSDDEIAAFRIYRYVSVLSKPHGQEGSLKLTELEIDIQNPQNTVITLGESKLTLTDKTAASIAQKTQGTTNLKQEITQTKTDLHNLQTQVDGEKDSLLGVVTEQNTTMMNTCEEIIFEALKSYTETDNFEAFKETVEAQLAIMSDQITLKFKESIERTEAVNGDLQSQLNTIAKYFTFDINGLTIGQADNPHKVIIDNDRYSMTVNGVEVMWISEGKVYTPTIEITKEFKLFDFLIDQDEAGNVNCSYAGGGE